MIVYDMTPRWIVVGLLALAPVLATPAVLAQQSPAPAAKQAPPPDDLEPGVNTSSMPSSSGSSNVSSSPSTAAPAAGDSAASAPKDSKSTTSSAAASKGAKHTTNPPASAPTAPTNSAGKGGKAEDHLQLDTTQITGNQELPKVLYIVPWKKSDLGDLLGKPANSLLDEVLQPVDRDVFKRENRYYDALKPDGPAGAANKGAGPDAGAGSQGSGDKR